MSEKSTYFFFILRPINNIKVLENSIRDFLQETVDGFGFQLVVYGFKEDGDDPFPKHYPIGIDQYIKTEITQASSDDIQKISMRFLLDEDDDLVLKVAIDTSERMSFIRVGYIFFKRKTWCTAILNLCISLHQNLKPFYGYGITSPTDFPRIGKFDEKVATKLYTYNFFGNDLANAFDRSKLLKIPAWKVKNLKDSGFFLAVEQNPFIEKEDITARYHQITKLLGLDEFQRAD
jgi:hypothetical protein